MIIYQVSMFLLCKLARLINTFFGHPDSPGQKVASIDMPFLFDFARILRCLYVLSHTHVHVSMFIIGFLFMV